MSAPPAGIELTPLALPPGEPVVERLRSLVLGERRLAAAFLYRRGDAARAEADGGRSLRPTVGLHAPVGRIDQELVARVLTAVGRIHGQTPLVVGLDAPGLEPVLRVAAPIGAGGRVEEAMVRALQASVAGTAPDGGAPQPDGSEPDGRVPDGDSSNGDDTDGRPTALPHGAGGLRLALAVADAVLTVPARPPLAAEGGRRLHRGDQVPITVLDTPEGRLATAFTSDLALLHTRPPVPGAVHIPGRVLAASLPDGVDLVLDPGCPLTAAVSAALVRAVGRAAPTGGA